MKPANISTVIGRDAELGAIVNAWRTGEPGVVVTATPGMGRTTLCAEVAAMLRTGGADVIELRPTATSQRVRLGALAPSLIDGPPHGDLLEGVRRVLRDRSNAGRVAVVVDDAHTLDTASESLLIEVVEAAVGGSRAFVVVSTPDGADTALTEHPDLARLRLAPLTIVALEAVLADHGVDPVGTPAGFGLADGNPGALLRRLTGERREGAGTLTVAVVTSRSARDLVETLAVAGQLTPLAAEALGVAGALTEATASGLVRLSDTGGVSLARLADPGLAADVRLALPALRSRALLRAVLAATEPAERSSDFVDLALRSGVPIAQADLRAAARRAYDAGEDAALNLARAAAAGGGPRAVERWISIAMERADDAELDLALEADGADRSPRARTAAAHVALWRRSDPEGALASLDTNDRVDRAVRAEVLALTGDAAGAAALADPLADSDDEAARLRATTALGHALRQQGRGVDAIRAFERGQAPRRRPNPAVDDVGPMVHALTLLDLGRWIEAEQLALDAIRSARRVESPVRRVRAAITLSVVAVERGHVDDAARHADVARQVLASTDRVIEHDWATVAAAMAGAMSGDQDAGSRRLDSLRGDRDVVTTLASLGARARAWSQPDTVIACDRLARSAVDLLDRGDVGAAASCLHDLALLGDPTRSRDALEQIAAEGFGELGTLRLDHVRAIADSDHETLSSLAATFAAVGAGRLAVESAAEAAVMAARAGAAQTARRYATDARRLAGACPGLATPALRAATTLLAGVTSPLTARERDVALRAAAGRSNRAIAEDLTLSERTVESHLARCYDKLGVRSRSELAGMLAMGRG